jgi:hypothetical protein
MTVSRNWCELDIDLDKQDLYTNKHDDWNLVFAHHKEEDNMYPLTTIEIAEAQQKDQELKGLTKRTLCGIVLFKLNTFFSHVFACP